MLFQKFCTSATVFLFILTEVFCNKQCIVQNITGSSFTTKRYMNSYVIREEHNSGPKMCIRDCLLQHGCNAINYNDNKNCELLITEESDTKSNIHGRHYSSITNWTMNPNQCWPNPCINRQRCIIALYGNHVCVPVDDACASNNPCQHGGSCRNTVEGTRCVCKDGFSGDSCEITPCTVHPCGVGSCAINGNTFKCTCPGYYTGNKCQRNPCYNNPCGAGTCTVAGYNFNCACPSFFTGSRCETDPCANGYCMNGGTCTMSGYSYSCQCSATHNGDRCDNIIEED
ncbi:fibropellin-3-like [Mytilus trossulus]|uniref:fibropellin-3-like n=1 Tax=Mytilus trossulus TaxID=6551 RepID=UPI0030054D6A